MTRTWRCGSLRLAKPWRLVLLSALAGLLCLEAAADPAVLERSWREHRSAHFRLLTDLDRRAAAERLRELEMFRSVVLRITGRTAGDADAPVDVLPVSRHRDFATLFGHGQLGFFLPTLTGRWMVSSAGAVGANQRQVLFHEYVHYLLTTASAIPYPPWSDCT